MKRKIILEKTDYIEILYLLGKHIGNLNLNLKNITDNLFSFPIKHMYRSDLKKFIRIKKSIESQLNLKNV